MELPNRPTKDPYQEIPIKDFSYINTQNHSSKKSKHHIGLIISAVIILVLLGAGAYLYGHYTKHKNIKHTSTATTTHKSVSTKATAAPSLNLTSYTSTPFNLTVSYPTTWTVSAEGSTSLNITSPEVTLTADTGKSVYGKEIVSVLDQGQIPAGFGSASVAVLDSQDINFTSPTSSQAAQTYVSFVQYPATDIKGGLDAIYVTGNNGYVKDQTIPSSDINQTSPLIIISFEQCQTQACTNLTSLTISSSMWNSSSFSTPILDILKSFTFS